MFRARKNWIRNGLFAALTAWMTSASLVASPPYRGLDRKAQTSPVEASPADSSALPGQGKPGQAIQSLEEQAQKDPGSPKLQAELGKAYYDRRDYVHAIPHLEAALKANPQDGESTQLLGLSYVLLGHLQQAIPLLEKVQSWLPRPDVTGSYVLGNSYLQTHQYDKARVAYAHMFSVPPDSASAHLVLAQMMVRQEFEELAIPELQKALALDPHIAMAHFLLGEIYLYKSNIPLALEEFQKELAVSPVLWMVYWRMGDAYTRVENWDEAERALKQAIWLNQDFSGSYILLGKVELKEGHPELATEFLERALRMDPTNYSGHYLLGTAFKALGRTADADREFALTRTLQAQKDQQ